MSKKNVMTRDEALDLLSQLGISDAEVYLIDVIPIIEIMWADGEIQKGGLEILDDYLNQHVKNINKLAGCKVLSIEHARVFAARFLKKRPNPKLLRTLRSFIGPVRLMTSDTAKNDEFQQTLLETCLDVASSSVTKYPYGLHERFNKAEKDCLFDILETLENFYKKQGTGIKKVDDPTSK